jgi:O-6-methylguanine DNA methyltransferase
MTADLTAVLEGLRTAAPPTLLPATLVAAGVADGYTRLDSAIGPVFVACNPHGVSAVLPAGDAVGFEEGFRRRHGREAFPVERLPGGLERRVQRALATGRSREVPFDLRTVSEFQAEVLRKTAEILPGEVRPYSWVAREIDRPGATRAVGSALRTNPIPLLIPCHRVVRADGTLGRYALGEDRKRRLLEAEGMDVAGYEAEQAAGTRFVGSATTGIYCYPTCRHARRIAPGHRVPFADGDEAATAGFRGCRDCRPAAVAA